MPCFAKCTSPVINVQDPAGKTVGRRRLRDSAKAAMALQSFVNDVRGSQGYGGLCSKGVYRFHSYDEADAWMRKALVERILRIQN